MEPKNSVLVNRCSRQAARARGRRPPPAGRRSRSAARFPCCASEAGQRARPARPPALPLNSTKKEVAEHGAKLQREWLLLAAPGSSWLLQVGCNLVCQLGHVQLAQLLEGPRHALHVQETAAGRQEPSLQKPRPRATGRPPRCASLQCCCTLCRRSAAQEHSPANLPAERRTPCPRAGPQSSPCGAARREGAAGAQVQRWRARAPLWGSPEPSALAPIALLQLQSVWPYGRRRAGSGGLPSTGPGTARSTASPPPPDTYTAYGWPRREGLATISQRPVAHSCSCCTTTPD